MLPVISDTMELEFQLLASLCHLSHHQNHSIRVGKTPTIYYPRYCVSKNYFTIFYSVKRNMSLLQKITPAEAFFLVLTFPLPVPEPRFS